MGTARYLVILLAVWFGRGQSEEVSFDDIHLTTTDDTDPNVQDNKDTGSYLFKIENELEKQDGLSLNVRIIDLMTRSTPFLRTHPAYVKCLQRIITYVQNNNEGSKVNIVSAYKTKKDIGSSTKIQDLYATAGTGAVLSVTDSNGSPGDITQLAQAASVFCPTIFASERQYLGIVMQASSVHIHMTGQSDTRSHYFSVDGYTAQTTQQFNTWAKEKLNKGLDPVASPDCSSFTAVVSGDTWPANITTPEQVVGSDDSDVNDKTDYMSRLVVYPGENFVYSETREKLMSPRMYEVIRKLQYLVRKNGDKLKIEKIFAEEMDSLHLEGRLTFVEMVTDNSASKIELLSKLARCTGADFVKNEGTKIQIAVKKQAAIDAKRVKFAQGEMLEVTPPSALVERLGSDIDNLPIFDGQFQRNKRVSELSQLNQYMSKNTRYIRLNPAIVQCYDNLLRHEKKWNSGADVSIPIIKSYLTAQELLLQFDPDQDPRGNAFSEGNAMLLNYGTGLDNSKYDIHRIVKTAISLCGPVFDDLVPKMAIGVGIYDDGVYLDTREQFMLWFGDSIDLPGGVEQGKYITQMEELFENAIIGRVVNPEDPIKACLNDDVPKPQSNSYKYVHPQHIQGKRRKRQAGNVDESCKVEEDTEFCKRSKPHRDNEINHLWEQFKRKHMIDKSYEQNLRQALEGCFGTCGTCLTGAVYEKKLEHCNNLLHWMDFRTMNDKPDVTNFIYTKNHDIKKYACKGDNNHCVIKSPLYAILASSVTALFRPDPTKSIEEELYSPTDNPSIVPELVYQIYAISAIGNITVWVKDEEELKFLRNPLKVAMLYNKNVTIVHVKVVNTESEGDVSLTLEGMITNWASTGCPTNSREVIAPYSISSVSSGHITKRDTKQYEHFSFGEQLLLRRQHWEHHWAESVRK